MKILSAETNLASATNVSNAPVVRLFNSGTDNILVTRKDYNAVVVGSFMVPSGEVVYAEKYFTDTLEGGADVKATKTAYSSMMSFVSSGGGSNPTYTYSVSASSVDEGGNWTTTVTTTNVDDNTTLYWSLSGTNITSADFSSGALTGSGTISNNTFNFSHTVAEDTLTEGTETVTIKLFTDSGRNTQVGNTVTVTLNDTSLTPTYTATVSHNSRDEGDSFTTTMTTTNVANSTELWWELSGTGIAAGDFSSGALTGSGTISNNTFNFSHTIANDNTTEGAETLNIKFYSDSGRTTQVGSTVTCTINDTSLTPPYYSNEFSAGDGMQVSGSTAQMSGFELDGNFTIECFFRVTTTDFPFTYRNIFNRWSNAEYQFQTHIKPASQANRFRMQTWVYFNDQSTTDDNTIVLNTWHHYALVRNNNNLRMYIDGVDKTSGGWSASNNFSGSNEEFRIGFRNDSSGYDFIGNISDVRYTVGQAIYTSNFSKPTEPLTTTSQGANASKVVFLGMQSSTVTATTKKPGGTTYEAGEGQTTPDISTDNPF